MTINEQVVSLELAKKLKELGVKQDSLFSYYREDGHFLNLTMNLKKYGELISAFTVAELGEMLPEGCRTWKYAEGWAGKFPGEENTMGSYDTEANGRARMLIYLIENNLCQSENL